MISCFFLLSSMNLGGVEKSFLELLSTLPPTENEVHVGLLQKKGALLDQLPLWVQVHEISVYQQYKHLINDPPLASIKGLIQDGRFADAFVHFLLYIHFKITGSRYLFYRYILRNEPVMDGEYDVAVSYAGPSQMIDYYVCEKVIAHKKYGWIHFDISHFGIDKGMTRRLYRKYEKIFVVSKEARDIFVKTFPEFADKTEVFYNVTDSERIRRQAEIAPSFDDGYLGRRILTVGRISIEKGQQLAIMAMKRVLIQQKNVRWYFVGEGKNWAACQELVRNEGLGDSVVFLGLQVNPYGFMKDCDLYVQPSLHEGYCLTLAEALCFGKPVVTTCFAGAKEQLQGKEDSWIADINPDSLSEMVVEALSRIDDNE